MATLISLLKADPKSIKARREKSVFAKIFNRRAKPVTSFDEFMRRFAPSLGRQEAYQEYRKRYWMAVTGREWSRRRRGVKSGRTRYRRCEFMDMSGVS